MKSFLSIHINHLTLSLLCQLIHLKLIDTYFTKIIFSRNSSNFLQFLSEPLNSFDLSRIDDCWFLAVFLVYCKSEFDWTIFTSLSLQNKLRVVVPNVSTVFAQELKGGADIFGLIPVLDCDFANVGQLDFIL